jgi:hypothetical protein
MKSLLDLVKYRLFCNGWSSFFSSSVCFVCVCENWLHLILTVDIRFLNQTHFGQLLLALHKDFSQPRHLQY